VRIYFYLLLLLIAAGCIYCLGVSGPLLFDDGVNLEPLQSVENHLVPWYAVIFTNPSSNVGRPVSMLSFFVNYWLFGFNVVAFKATNILLHLAIGVALFVFIRRLLRSTVYFQHRDRVALFATGCWLLSPFYVSTVLYVVQRMAMLSTLFTLLALSAYLALREYLEVGRLRWSALGLFCIYALLGVLSKENAVLLPAFILVLELFFCTPIRDALGRRLWQLSVAVLAGLPAVATVMLMVLKRTAFFDYASRPFDLLERLLTEARIVWSYVGSLLLPRSSDFGLFHDDIQISKSLLSPASTTIALVGWLVVVALIFYARRNSLWRPLAGCVAFFLAGHLLESTIFPLELYFEHRNYLPGAGLYLLLALVAEMLVQNGLSTYRTNLIVFGAYMLVFMIALSQRALIWSRYDNIVYSSYQSHPNSPRSIVEAASLDAQRGKFDDAMMKLDYARNANLVPALGANLQTVWVYCLGNRIGLIEKINDLFAEVPLDGRPYSTLAIKQVNELFKNRPCENVPYARVVSLLAEKIERYYKSGEYLQPDAARKGNIDSLNVRVLEGLNLTRQPQKMLDMIAAINEAGRGGVSSDLLGAVALVSLGRLDEAWLLIAKLKADSSMDARMEAEHIAYLEEVYREELKMKQEKNDG